MGQKLTPKQKRFCLEYIVDLNATRAAIRSGYSKKTAAEIGAENLIKPNVSQFIKSLMDKRANKIEVTAEKVLQELAKIGFSNIQDYIKTGNEIDDIPTIDPDKARAIQSIKVKTTKGETWDATEVSFRLHDKISALEKIARHIGFFAKDNEQLKSDPQIFKFGNQKISF